MATACTRYAGSKQQLPQFRLGQQSPLAGDERLHKLRPELFKKQPYYRPSDN